MYLIRRGICQLLSWLVLFSPAIALGAVGDIIFVAQVPQPADFTTIGSTFGNHGGSVQSAPRGGDLYVRYADGTLKNLTRSAGYGKDGFQDQNAIAVRDPAVHWDGAKVLFSMVIGSPAQQYETNEYRWQLYEVTGLGIGETVVITKVSGQPANFNNVMPTYGTDGRIIFSSDRPRNGASHLYPQLDEYESAPTNSGLWSLDPATGDLILLDHAPSGAFHPIVDSFGRVIYSRWDHLQRDQQAGELTDYGAFTYSDETASAARLNTQFEFFPEARSNRESPLPNMNLHSFNHFFPWQVNEDGTEHETLNHIGRHELHGYVQRTFTDDGNIDDFYGQFSRFNQNEIFSFFQVREDPRNPGKFFGIDAPEFSTHAAGQIVAINGAPSVIPALMQVSYFTPRDTSSYTNTPGPLHTGLYRNPLPLADGRLVAAHTAETREEDNEGSRAFPLSRYDFRIKTLRLAGSYWVADQPLTPGITKNITYYDPDVLVTYNGQLWELQPVELLARSRPQRRVPHVEAPEQAIFDELGINPATFKEYLRVRDLALIVTRNATSRDALDIQQPLNLRVHNSSTQKLPFGGKVYSIAHLQIFQGDQIRGYGGTDDPREGRRVLAQPLHDFLSANPPNPGGPQGSVRVGADGSIAALVPARRALTWQLTDSAGAGVIRERYWLTFQPGEIRVCASCHGLSDRDQTGQTTPVNSPQALRDLLLFINGNPIPESPPNSPPNNPGGNPPVEPTPPPSPPAPPAPPPPPEPGFGLSVSTKIRRQMVPGFFISRKAAEVTWSSLTPATGPAPATIVVAINGQSCPRPMMSGRVSGGAPVVLTGTAPKTKYTLSIKLSLLANGTENTSVDVPLFGKSAAGSPTPLTVRQMRDLCKSFTKFKVKRNRRR